MTKGATEVRKSNSAMVMSSRIRLARNLSGFKFVNSASLKELEDILEISSIALSKVRKFKDGLLFKMSDIPDFNRQLLLENRSVSKELIENTEGKAVFLSKDDSTSAMINEEDHLRIQILSTSLSLSTIWRSLNALDDSIEEHLEFAFSPKYGYLTACPTNLGTGMRASVMMHLPALVLTEQMEKIIRGVNQLGMVVRGASGEGSDSFGAFFQLSNQHTLGISESDIVKKITKFAKKLCEFEINARKKLFQEDSLVLLDKIFRAKAVLQSCKLINTAESISCLSSLRLAADMGILGVNSPALIGAIDSALRQVQPSHLQLRFNRFDITAHERDALRASMLNEFVNEHSDSLEMSK